MFGCFLSNKRETESKKQSVDTNIELPVQSDHECDSEIAMNRRVSDGDDIYEQYLSKGDDGEGHLESDEHHRAMSTDKDLDELMYVHPVKTKGITSTNEEDTTSAETSGVDDTEKGVSANVTYWELETQFFFFF